MRKSTGFLLGAVLLPAAMLVPRPAAGEEIAMRAGSASAVMAKVDPAAATLRITGSVNAEDLHLINTRFRNLSELDLGEVTIEGCHAEGRMAVNRRDYPADILPAYTLAGLTASRLTLPSTIKGIADGALTGASVSAVVIPDGVTEIGMGAFAACGNLESVALGAGTALIGNNAFQDCTSLRSVKGGMALVRIGAKAFAGCSRLTEVDFAAMAGLNSIDDEAFAATGLREADMSRLRGLSHVGARAFACCPDLGSVLLPPSVTALGEGVLMGCRSLESFLLPAGVSELPDLALAGLGSVKTVTIPSSVKRIGSAAFGKWESLEEIDATALDNVPELGEEVWTGVRQKDTVLKVNESVAGEFAAADQWKEFQISVGDNSAVTLPTADSAQNTRRNLSAQIDGAGRLTVSADSPMASVKIFDTDGRLLHSARLADVTEAAIATGLRADGVMIIAATFTDGPTAGIKIAPTR